MKLLVHKSEDRGFADHGWLKARHSFSFASWYNPDKIHFGALRVLNDDEVAAGMGFGTHPHDNMEIITIPLEGSLEHKDSMGNGSVIRAGEIQYMRAGSGVKHSEFNPSQKDPAKLLQIWIFPAERNVVPSYAQLSFSDQELKNQVHTLLSPNQHSGKIQINQKAWVSLSKPEKGTNLNYKINRDGNGLYIFVIEGCVKIDTAILNRRDAAGITDSTSMDIQAKEDSYLLILDVPFAY